MIHFINATTITTSTTIPIILFPMKKQKYKGSNPYHPSLIASFYPLFSLLTIGLLPVQAAGWSDQGIVSTTAVSSSHPSVSIRPVVIVVVPQYH
jgi:hypothetical protein